jgi:hypothetical protein
MTRMNWTASNNRRRIREQGAESVDGLAIGRHSAPSAQQAAQPRPRGPKLSEPVTVESFWANRAHDACVVTLSTFKNHNLIDIRKHSMNGTGQLVPTPKGIALTITRLPDLAKAIDKALRKARELGLLPQDEGAAE